MKKILSVVVLSLVMMVPAFAQLAPAKVNQPWFMLSKPASPISVTTSSSATLLPQGLVLWACNTGSNDGYLNFGNANTVVATKAGGTWLKASTCASYDLFPISANNAYSYLAAIGDGGSTTIYIETGIGQPPNALSSSGGGGGSGAVFGPTAVGLAAANPPVLIGGTVDGTATGAVSVLKVLSGVGYINCANCSGSGISVAYGGAIGTVGTPDGYKDGSGNFQPFLGDVTNGQWVSIKASVPIAVTGTFWQATQPVSGTVTANLGTIGGIATAATQGTTADAPCALPATTTACTEIALQKAIANAAVNGTAATGGGVPTSAIYFGVNVGGNLVGMAPGTAGSAGSQVWSAQGVSGMTPLAISRDTTANSATHGLYSNLLQSDAVISATNGIYSNLLQGNAAISATNGIYVNLLQGNAVISATNGTFTNVLQGNAVVSLTNPSFTKITDGTTANTIKAASTPSVSTDTAIVVDQRPGTTISTKAGFGAAQLSSASVDISSSGDNIVVTRAVGTIKVYGLELSCASNQTKILMKDGASTTKGAFYNVGTYAHAILPEPAWTTTGTDNFIINLSNATACGGTVWYLDN